MSAGDAELARRYDASLEFLEAGRFSTLDTLDQWAGPIMKQPFVGGLVALAGGVLCLLATIHMLRSGKVYGGRGHTGRAYTRAEWPVTFWFHVAVGIVVTVAMLALALRRLIPG